MVVARLLVRTLAADGVNVLSSTGAGGQEVSTCTST